MGECDMCSLSVKPISNFARNTARWVFDALPSWELKNNKVINGIKWAGQHISSPQNRLILGASALMSQPFIDLYNKNVNEDTRKVSAARTVAKIIAGTTTGFLVRYYTIKAVEKFTQHPTEAKKTLFTSLFPPKYLNAAKSSLKQYKFALGTFISLGVMLITNFAIDAPLTKLLTNIFVKKIYDKENKETNNTQNNRSIPTFNDKPEPQTLLMNNINMDEFINKNKKEAK